MAACDPRLNISIVPLVAPLWSPLELTDPALSRVYRKNQGGWDFYSTWKALMRSILRQEIQPSELEAHFQVQKDPFKVRAFADASQNFLQILADTRHSGYFPLPQGSWVTGNVRITARCDIGMYVDGHPTGIKLWMSKEHPLDPEKADLISQGLVLAMRDAPATHFAVWDVHRSKAYRPLHKSDRNIWNVFELNEHVDAAYRYYPR